MWGVDVRVGVGAEKGEGYGSDQREWRPEIRPDRNFSAAQFLPLLRVRVREQRSFYWMSKCQYWSGIELTSGRSQKVKEFTDSEK